MNVQIQTIRYELDERVRNHVQKRVDKMQTFHDKIIEVEVYLKEENKSDKDKVAEIKIAVPGSSLFAKHESNKMEESIDKAFDSIVSQIKKMKSKVKA